MSGWNETEVAKLLVLLLYTGLPQDILLFCGENTMSATQSLSVFGLHSPLFVSMRSDFWSSIEPDDGPPDFTLVPTQQGQRTVQRVESVSLRRVYNLQLYRCLRETGLGRGVTHNDDVTAILGERKACGLRPFQRLSALLGSTFHVSEQNDPIVELLFRFVYIYETKFKALADGQVKFMMMATLEMFNEDS
jgi:hypothetical protein